MENINEILNIDNNFINNILNKNNMVEIIKINNIVIEGKPENYVRERSGRGSHFYNPKGKKMEEFKKTFIKTISKEDYKKMKDNLSGNYYVYFDINFYIPIAKTDSKKTKVMKEFQQILPNKRPDLDNYEKFVLDSLHDVVYDDDSKVVWLNCNKYYSINPRTEINITIKTLKEI